MKGFTNLTLCLFPSFLSTFLNKLLLMCSSLKKARLCYAVSECSSHIVFFFGSIGCFENNVPFSAIFIVVPNVHQNFWAINSERPSFYSHSMHTFAQNKLSHWDTQNSLFF